MKLSKLTISAVALSLAAAAPAVATKPDHPGKGKGQAKAKNVVLKGLVVSADATTVTVAVKKATRWGRALRGTDVQFTVAKVVADDVNGDGKADALDLAAGDKVVVQARIGTSDVAPYSARRVVDQTHPPVDDDGDDAPVEASAG
jgi:hypothetical protein